MRCGETATSACISITGSVCTNVLVSGNLCSGGAYSITEGVTTPTKLAAIGNMMTGYGSANLNGTWDLGVASTTNTDFKNGY